MCRLSALGRTLRSVSGHLPEVGERFGLAQKNGIEVVLTEEDAPAQNAGHCIEDVIVAFAGKPITSMDDLVRVLTQHPIALPAGFVVIHEDCRIERTTPPPQSTQVPCTGERCDFFRDSKQSGFHFTTTGRIIPQRVAGAARAGATNRFAAISLRPFLVF